MYKEDGSIKVTDTKYGCLAAAIPNEEEEYKNHCVECLTEHFKDQVTTLVIPNTPAYLKTPQRFGRGASDKHSMVSNMTPLAPTHAILAAHTITPLDECGGHIDDIFLLFLS